MGVEKLAAASQTSRWIWDERIIPSKPNAWLHECLFFYASLYTFVPMSDPITCRTLGEGLRPFLSTSATSLCLAVRTLHWNIPWHHHLPGSSRQRESGQHKRSCNLRRVLVYNDYIILMYITYVDITLWHLAATLRHENPNDPKWTHESHLFANSWPSDSKSKGLRCPEHTSDSWRSTYQVDYHQCHWISQRDEQWPRWPPLLHSKPRWPFLGCGALRGRMPASSQFQLGVALCRQMFVRSTSNRALSNQ